ncbi:MAG: glycosyltransferase [Solirubrobacterales bacterium]
MRRVLWIIPTLSRDFGGPSSTAVNGVIAENRSGIEAELITTVDRQAGSVDPGIQRLTQNQVAVRTFPRSDWISKSEAWGMSLKMTFWMLRNVRSFDVIHLQYVWCWTSIWGSILGKMFRIPVVMTPHESLTDYDIDVASNGGAKRAVKLLLRQFFLRTVDQFIFMSELEVRDTRSGPVPYRLISHAVVEEPHDPPTPVDREPGPLRIAFLGRNVAKKGIDRIITAMAANRDKGWELFVAGPPGPESFVEHCQALSQDLGIENNVHWLGFVEDRTDLLKRCDVLAMPSAYEGFGMAAAEAMSHAVPVIVPKDSGVAEIVSEFKAGIVLEAPTAEILEQALVEFDSSRDKWQDYRENGIRSVNSRLTYAAYASATDQLYGSLL